MFLRSLSISNIRSLAHLEIDFTTSTGGIRQWTCLLGDNGTGKSSVLRSAALIMAGSDALPDILGDPARWIRHGSKKAIIRAEIQTQDGAVRSIALELHAGDGITATLKRNESNLQPLDAALRHASRSYFTVGYGVSRRPSHSEGFTAPGTQHSPRSSGIATLFQSDAVLRSITAWAMDLHYQRGAAGLTTIRTALGALLPDATFAGIDKDARQLLFKTMDGRIPLTQLSDGYQNVIAWCGDLLFRITEVFQDYKNPLLARGLLLVDEVDLHLHPTWQRQVIQFLRSTFPHLQFLTTTHSALTAQQCGEGELFILKREGSKTILRPYGDAPNLLRIDQLLVSPVFGLDTGMSAKVEAVRKLPHRTREQKEFLQSLPRPRTQPDQEREKIALLKTIKTTLRSAAPAAASAGPAAVRSKSPATKRASRAPAVYVRPSADSVIRSALKMK